MNVEPETLISFIIITFDEITFLLNKKSVAQHKPLEQECLSWERKVTAFSVLNCIEMSG